jgi:CMP-2-keto-3-deoxyoctulosonic acid synthetase
LGHQNHQLVTTCQHKKAQDNIKTEETVVSNFNQRKTVLQDYLSKHNIPFEPLETKKQLYEKIKLKKPLSVFKTDKIANLHGHEDLNIL